MLRTTAAVMAVFGAALLGFAPAAVAANADKTLYTFGPDYGDNPTGGLVADELGNLYGTVEFQGAHGFGYVYELSPKAGGRWSFRDVWDFTAGYDGAFPEGLLTFDGAGNLYGTTVGGGNPDGSNFGAVFELKPGKSGAWSLAGAYDLTGGLDGSDPRSGVVVDDAGNLYGTASQGGVLGFGTLFKLTPSENGGFQYTNIHQFQYGADGGYPTTNLTLDHKNNVFGSVQYGGTFGTGYVFEFSPSQKGWKETVLHNFGDGDTGGTSYGALVLSKSGNLFGTTAGYIQAKAQWHGSVFELSKPPQPGTPNWSVTTLYQFTGGADGGLTTGVVFDKEGDIYGNYVTGGADSNGGVYKLTPSVVNGKTVWTENVLYSFTGGDDGCGPGSVIFDEATSKRIFGVTGLCGANQHGTAFAIKR